MIPKLTPEVVARAVTTLGFGACCFAIGYIKPEVVVGIVFAIWGMKTIRKIDPIAAGD
mgnify:CR=1 FL=1